MDTASPPLAGHRACAVLMERKVLANRWASESWRPLAVVPDEPGAPRELGTTDDGATLWLHPGFRVELFTDEAEGYYLNLTASTPFVFVNWEMTDALAVPRSVTVSYNEAARQLDGGAQVEGVPLPAEWLPWIAAFTDRHFKIDEKKKRIRPPSFKGARRDA